VRAASEGEAGMLTVETIGRVRREFHAKGKKIKAIARELRVYATPAELEPADHRRDPQHPGAATAASGIGADRAPGVPLAEDHAVGRLRPV